MKKCRFSARETALHCFGSRSSLLNHHLPDRTVAQAQDVQTLKPLSGSLAVDTVDVLSLLTGHSRLDASSFSKVALGEEFIE